MARGAMGFAVVSVAAFSVWTFAGDWFYANVGEGGLYPASALVFIALSGLFLRGLVEGPRSLRRFYRIFVPAFVAYAIVWCAAWFAFSFGLGEWLGSLGGSMAFCAVAGLGFRTLRPWPAASAVMAVTHSAGYFLGSMALQRMAGVAAAMSANGAPGDWVLVAGKLLWGLLYGLGFGAGLGFAFFRFHRQRSAIGAEHR